ncbi:MAG: hypothetical protein FD137_2445, partial [Spirochaetes bacterium]
MLAEMPCAARRTCTATFGALRSGRLSSTQDVLMD